MPLLTSNAIRKHRNKIYFCKILPQGKNILCKPYLVTYSLGASSPFGRPKHFVRGYISFAWHSCMTIFFFLWYPPNGGLIRRLCNILGSILAVVWLIKVQHKISNYFPFCVSSETKNWHDICFVMLGLSGKWGDFILIHQSIITFYLWYLLQLHQKTLGSIQRVSCYSSVLLFSFCILLLFSCELWYSRKWYLFARKWNPSADHIFRTLTMVTCKCLLSQSISLLQYFKICMFSFYYWPIFSGPDFNLYAQLHLLLKVGLQEKN